MKKRFLFLLCVAVAMLSCDTSNDSSPNLAGSGTGGSLASFLVTGDNLYVVSGLEVRTFNLAGGDGLVPTGTLTLDSYLETIFLYETKLFIGSNDAVFFLDIDDPDHPRFISEYRHITSCDPVVARHGIAYTTLRSSGCRFAGADLLDVLDVSDLQNPRMIASYNVDTPYGLAVTENFLFVCESGGISVIDHTDPSDLQWLERFTFDSATVPFDIIALNNRLIVTTDQGIFNVAYDEEGKLTILGEITKN